MSLANQFSDPGNKFLGSGYFSTVVQSGENEVIKSRQREDEDESSDDFSYLVWCHKRLMRYGARSPEMYGLPLVWEVSEDRKYARMSKLEPIYNNNGYWVDREAFRLCHGDTGSMCGKLLMPAVYSMLRRVFKGARFDTHAHNVMWCPVRECYVLNDPFSRNPTSVGNPTPKKTNSWRPKYGPH